MAGTAGAQAQQAERARFVLVGASIGQDWNLAGLAARTGQTKLSFEALQAWQYDKSEALSELLMRPSRQWKFSPGFIKSLFRPAPVPANYILIKECSAYFPGDTPQVRKQELIDAWVGQIRKKGIVPLIATVVPVTLERSRKDPGKQESLRAFNDWLREYSSKQGVQLVDLEAALRSDAKDRYLRDDLTSGDGSHLNAKAYEILDRLLVDSLCGGVAAANCTPPRPPTR